MQIKYELHEGQLSVWNSPARWRVLVAGRRFGKTILAVHELMRKALSRPKAKVWYTAPYYTQAKLICWQLIQDIVPREIIAKRNESELWIELINGSRIYLKGCDNEDSLVGVGLDFIVPDEYALYKPHVWPKILRPMLSDSGGGALFIGTPRGKNTFWELWMRGQRKETGWQSWQMPTRINPWISLEEIEEAKKTLSERVFRQEYEASFEDFSGMIWPEFNKEHLIEPFPIPENWQRVAAIDPAVSGTTACIKAAVDPHENIYIYSEYREENKRVDEVVQAIQEDNIDWLIDPNSKSRTIVKEGKIYSIHNEYVDHGIYANSAENDVDYGINRVAEYLKTGKLKIFKTLKWLPWEIERYHWSEVVESRTGISKPVPYKADDHACLVGETSVTLADGTERELKDIRIGDRVKTSNGSQRVIDSRKTGENEEIWKVRFTNGVELSGTKDHRLYTPHGKVAISEMRTGTICLGLNTAEECTIGMRDTMQKVAESFVCTLKYGYRIMARYPMGIVSTIKTITRQTTIYPIWNLCIEVSIPHIIPARISKTQSIERRIVSLFPRLESLLKYGTLRARAGNGTVNILKKSGRIRQSTKRTVCGVAKNTKLISQSVRNSVIKTARPFIVEGVLRESRKRAVYNITVENEHCYFANGVLSANCDCMRYIVASRPRAGKVIAGEAMQVHSAEWFEALLEAQKHKSRRLR